MSIHLSRLVKAEEQFLTLAASVRTAEIREALEFASAVAGESLQLRYAVLTVLRYGETMGFPAALGSLRKALGDG